MLLPLLSVVTPPMRAPHLAMSALDSACPLLPPPLLSSEQDYVTLGMG